MKRCTILSYFMYVCIPILHGTRYNKTFDNKLLHPYCNCKINHQINDAKITMKLFYLSVCVRKEEIVDKIKPKKKCLGSRTRLVRI